MGGRLELGGSEDREADGFVGGREGTKGYTSAEMV